MWLSGVPAPSNHKLGPLGGGKIRHDFFQDDVAPLPFVSVKALERYVEKICIQYLYFLTHPSSTNIKSEKCQESLLPTPSASLNVLSLAGSNSRTLSQSLGFLGDVRSNWTLGVTVNRSQYHVT